MKGKFAYTGERGLGPFGIFWLSKNAGRRPETAEVSGIYDEPVDVGITRQLPQPPLNLF